MGNLSNLSNLSIEKTRDTTRAHSHAHAMRAHDARKHRGCYKKTTGQIRQINEFNGLA
jgi:hypothetical protein